MEIFDNDKTRKAYYVFPWGYTPVSAIKDVAKEKHINPDRLEVIPGWVKGDELFLEHKRGSKKVLVVTKHTKIGG